MSGGRVGGQNGTGQLREFEEFVAARSPSLMRTAYLLVGHREAAEDLVQSALERTFPRWHRVRRMELPEAYVRRILINKAHETWRSSRRLPVVDAPSDESETARTATDDHADGVALRESLLQALDELPHGMRTVVVLRYWEEMSVQEVADVLHCSAGNVKAQASRGLERLRHLITVESGSSRG
jgi:RNA polymerase sigma-70 factor (sigma-E family)